MDNYPARRFARFRITRNVIRWFTLRKQKPVFCMLPFVLKEAAARWVTGPEHPVTITRDDYRTIQAALHTEYSRQGLRFVGPPCSWESLLAFAYDQSSRGGELLYWLQTPTLKLLSVSLTRHGDDLYVMFAPSNEQLEPCDSLDGLVNWRQVIAIPSAK